MITSTKTAVAASSAVPLCLIKAYSPLTETFLFAHAERLPATVTIVHDFPPKIGERLLSPQSRLDRLARKARRVLGRGQNKRQQTTAAYLQALRESRAAAVLAEYGISGVAALDACRATNVPLIVHFHGYDAYKKDTLAKHAQNYAVMFREAAAIVAVSHAMRRQLISLGAPPEKVHYNPCGVDCHLFDAAEPAKAAPVFLSIGRFVEKKAPHLTLLAFAEVLRRHPDARLRMIGDGPLWESCHDLAKGLGIAEAVTFLGAQPHAVVREETRAARCFVQHSIEALSGDSEGTPVAVLEAGASGLPVVATRHAGIPDVVIEEETGLLVDEHDVDGMAEQMSRLAGDAHLAGVLGGAARRRIQNHFSMEISIGRLWAIIEATLAHKPGLP